jgi:hypothetical protein
MKDIIVLDEETGVTLTYKWGDSYGWCVSFSDEAYTDNGIDNFKKVMEHSRKYWPEVPDEFKEQIEENNRKMREVCRGIVIEDWEEI